MSFASTSTFQGSYSVQYNRKFREVFWRGIGHLTRHERQLLFAVNTGKSDRVGRLLLHSTRSLEELALVESLLDRWPHNLAVHLQFLRRRLGWLQNTAVGQVHRFLLEEVERR